MNMHDPDFMTAHVTITYKICLPRIKDRQKHACQIAEACYSNMLREVHFPSIANIKAKVLTDDDFVAECSERKDY